jgi:hypothetical protein
MAVEAYALYQEQGNAAEVHRQMRERYPQERMDVRTVQLWIKRMQKEQRAAEADTVKGLLRDIAESLRVIAGRE